jgi:hypothetical protein
MPDQVIITQVRNAQSLNSDNTSFDVEIKHPQYDWIPYTLNSDDEDMTVDNSVVLELIGSNYAVYVAPTQEELDAELSAELRSERDQKLAQEVDPIITNPLRWAELTEVKQAEWTQYRTDLLNLPNQVGFPNTVTWPTKPS